MQLFRLLQSQRLMSAIVNGVDITFFDPGPETIAYLTTHRAKFIHSDSDVYNAATETTHTQPTHISFTWMFQSTDDLFGTTYAVPMDVMLGLVHVMAAEAARGVTDTATMNYDLMAAVSCIPFEFLQGAKPEMKWVWWFYRCTGPVGGPSLPDEPWVKKVAAQFGAHSLKVVLPQERIKLTEHDLTQITVLTACHCVMDSTHGINCLPKFYLAMRSALMSPEGVCDTVDSPLVPGSIKRDLEAMWEADKRRVEHRARLLAAIVHMNTDDDAMALVEAAALRNSKSLHATLTFMRLVIGAGASCTYVEDYPSLEVEPPSHGWWTICHVRSLTQHQWARMALMEAGWSIVNRWKAGAAHHTKLIFCAVVGASKAHVDHMCAAVRAFAGVTEQDTPHLAYETIDPFTGRSKVVVACDKDLWRTYTVVSLFNALKPRTGSRQVVHRTPIADFVANTLFSIENKALRTAVWTSFAHTYGSAPMQGAHPPDLEARIIAAVADTHGYGTAAVSVAVMKELSMTANVTSLVPMVCRQPVPMQFCGASDGPLLRLMAKDHPTEAFWLSHVLRHTLRHIESTCRSCSDPGRPYPDRVSHPVSHLIQSMRCGGGDRVVGAWYSAGSVIETACGRPSGSQCSYTRFAADLMNAHPVSPASVVVSHTLPPLVRSTTSESGDEPHQKRRKRNPK